MPPAQGGASSGPGPGLQLREGPWRGQSPLVLPWKRKLLQQNLLTALGKWKGWVFFPPESLLSDHVALFVQKPGSGARARSHCLAGLPPPTESQGQSYLPSLGEVGCGCVISRSRKHWKQSLKTHRQAGSSPLENLFRNLTINWGKQQQNNKTEAH